MWIIVRRFLLSRTFHRLTAALNTSWCVNTPRRSHPPGVSEGIALHSRTTAAHNCHTFTAFLPQCLSASGLISPTPTTNSFHLFPAFVLSYAKQLLALVCVDVPNKFLLLKSCDETRSETSEKVEEQQRVNCGESHGT